MASDDAPDVGTDGAGAGIMMGYKKVTVMVTDLEEMGMVTLSSRQPQVGVELTATLVDPEVDWYGNSHVADVEVGEVPQQVLGLVANRRRCR